MPTSQRKNYTSVQALPLAAPQVWQILTNFDNRSLFPQNAVLELNKTEENSFSGFIRVGSTRFEASFVPYNIRLTAPQLKLGLQLQPQVSGCTVMVVASVAEDSPLAVDDAAIADFFTLLNRLASGQSAPKAAPVSSASLQEQPRAASPQGDGRDELATQLRQRRDAQAARRATKRRGRAAAVVVLLLALLAGGGFLAVHLIRKQPRPQRPAITQTTEIPGGNSLVTLETAFSLKAGMSRSEIEKLLGKPAAKNGSSCRYLSRTPNAFGDAAVQVLVEYSGDSAARVSVLDLNAATEIGAVGAEALSVTPDSTADTLAEQAGCRPSLYRSFLEGEVLVTQYHFGYLDPKANFSALWQGELSAEIRSDGSTGTAQGYRFDGADPLFCSSLEGHPFSRQYADFDSYLADFYEYQTCMEIMQFHYSRGDCDRVLGGMTAVSTVDDVTLHQASSAFALEDGTPVWAHTVGINTRGAFSLLSSANRRLWQQPTDLADRDLSFVDIGIGLNELLQGVGMMPSAVYVDRSYLVLAFGRYLPEGSSQFEQFELMVQLQQNDMVVSKVYNNTEMDLVIT